MKTEQGKLFIISGPSGCGKSTVLHEVFLRRDMYFFSVSATTRKPRPGEKNGENYLFMESEDFIKMIENDEFLEYAEYVGNYYGTPAKPIIEHLEKGYDVFLDVEVQGKTQVKKKMPEAVSIFLTPPSLKILADRLRGRGTETEEKIRGRLVKAEAEMSMADTYDYVVVNDDVSRAAGEIIDIIEKCKK